MTAFVALSYGIHCNSTVSYTTRFEYKLVEASMEVHGSFMEVVQASITLDLFRAHRGLECSQSARPRQRALARVGIRARGQVLQYSTEVR